MFHAKICAKGWIFFSCSSCKLKNTRNTRKKETTLCRSTSESLTFFGLKASIYTIPNGASKTGDGKIKGQIPMLRQNVYSDPCNKVSVSQRSHLVFSVTFVYCSLVIFLSLDLPVYQTQFPVNCIWNYSLKKQRLNNKVWDSFWAKPERFTGHIDIKGAPNKMFSLKFDFFLIAGNFWRHERTKHPPLSLDHNTVWLNSDYSLAKVGSAVQTVELILIRARLGLWARRFGSEEAVSGSLFCLLSLAVTKSDEGVELFPLLHLLLWGQRTRRARFKPDQIQSFVQFGGCCL